MKILFIAEFFPSDEKLNFSGGVEAYNYFLVRELTKKNKVIVVCRRTSKNKDTKQKNLKIIRLGRNNVKINAEASSLPSRATFLLEGLKWGLKQEFDIVQGNNFVTYPLAFLLGKLKNKPAVAWYPDVFIGKWFKLFGVLSGFVGELTERISLLLPWAHFITLSKSTKKKLEKAGIKSDKIVTIYAGVDSNFFRKIKVNKKKEFTISCVVRLVSYKRVDLLIRAAKLLIDKDYRIRVEIIGDGPEKNNLEELINKLNITKRVLISSGLSRGEMGRRIKLSHLFCLPSEEEGFGLVVLEAAACGVPYIVSDIPVFREITIQGKGGLFFQPGSYIDLARKIEIFIKNKNLRKKSAQNSFELVKNYSWNKVAQEFKQVYQNITTKKLRILMLIDAWFPHIGGGQVHVWELSKQLANLGCNVSIFTRNLGKWKEKYDGIHVVQVGNHKKFANIWGRISYLIKALFYSLWVDYDILHTHAFSPGLIAPFVKFFKNKPIVYTVHGKGMKIAGLNLNGAFLEDFVTYKIPYDLEITVARSTLIKKTAAKKTVVIPNGINLSRFIPAQRERIKVKKLLYVGRLVYDKGVDLLIGAMKILNKLELLLTIVGEGPERKYLEQLAKDTNVKFKGKLIGSDLVAEYKKADILVLPSRVEGHPIRLFEAWASKLPVIVTNTGDNKKYVKAKLNGYLSRIDAYDMASKIKLSIKQNALNKMGENGFQIAKKYTWDKIAHKTITEYKKLI